MVIGFNCCNVIISEGGLINEEYCVCYVVDWVEMIFIVFMGLMVGCVVCYDYKFDFIF